MGRASRFEVVSVLALTTLLVVVSGCSSPSTEKSPSRQDGSLALGLAIPLPAGIATDGKAIAPSGSYSEVLNPKPADEKGSVSAKENRSDLKWAPGRIYVKAGVLGFHFNLNQEAKSVDSSADNWSLVFKAEAPFRAEDKLFFCGPTGTVTIQVYDAEQDLLLWNGIVSGVPLCV